jgi:MYXO-CTERM domain-containing protein
LVTSRSVSITVGNTGGGGGGGNSLTDNEIQGGCATGQTSAPWSGVVLLGFVVGLLRRRR